MPRHASILLLTGLVACGGNAKNKAPDSSKDGDHPVVPAPLPPPPPPAPTATPQSLYAECEQRVEGPQKDAECTSDAECATAGCGNEVCTTTAEKVNVMTTCEDKLCFKVLDSCGCREGKCSWSLKAEVPAGQVPTTPGGSLPPSLPPTGTPVPAPAPAPDPH